MDFTDDGVSSFSAPVSETVSRAQAFQALSHWLRTGVPLPAEGRGGSHAASSATASNAAATWTTLRFVPPMGA